MPKEFFIGADGGGTKTKVLIEDIDGQVIGEAVSGPGNIRTSVEGSWNSLMKGINEALQNSGVSLQDPEINFHAGFGLAGYEIPEAADRFINTPHPFKTLKLDSDAIIACMGAHAGEDGAIIIVGTGVHGCEIYQHEITHVGGWGFPHGDKGGGAWLGMEALRQTLKSIDGRAEPSLLTQRVLQQFDTDLNDLLAWASEATPGDYATLAPYVFECAAQHDVSAEELLNIAAAEIDLVGMALFNATHDIRLPVCLFGGIAPLLAPRFRGELKQQIIDRRFGAPKGAIFLVRKAVLGDNWQIKDCLL